MFEKWDASLVRVRCVCDAPLHGLEGKVHRTYKLKDAAAYFAADQILVHAHEMIEAHTSVRPAEY